MYAQITLSENDVTITAVRAQGAGGQAAGAAALGTRPAFRC
jgi:protein subunit release factor A